MLCARCANPLQANVPYCQVCGLPVNPRDPRFNNTTIPGSANGNTGQPGMASEYIGPPMQNFPTNANPQKCNTPGQTTLYPPAPAPGSQGPAMPSAWPVMPGQSGPSSFNGSIMPAPAQPKRRKHSLGWIIFSVVLVVVLIFAGLITTVVVVGSHVIATGQAKRAAAMQTYQQVMSKPPIVNDALTSATSSWSTYQRPPYTCTQEKDGLYVSSAQINEFAPCFNSQYGVMTNFAFQITMSVTRGNGGGLLFRASSNSPSFYLFRVDLDGAYLISAYQGAAASDARDLTHGFAGSLTKQVGAANVLTVIARGQQLDFYINQTFITQVQDKTFARGIVGVVASDEGTPTQIVYTNAKIWNLGV